MRAWIISDLQLDLNPVLLRPEEDISETADVCIMAGDIHKPLSESMIAARAVARKLPVIYVPGNRDFYFRVMEDEIALAKERAQQLGIHLLIDETIEFAGARIIGSTLWADMKLATTQDQRDAIRRQMNDFKHIRTRAGRWTPETMLATHEKSIAFIRDELSKGFNGPSIVITHHAPHPKSIPPKHEHSPANGAFASDLSDLLSGIDAPDIWIHGGLHHNVDYQIGRTRVFSNSRGYSELGPGMEIVPENPQFDPRCVIEPYAHMPAFAS